MNDIWPELPELTEAYEREQARRSPLLGPSDVDLLHRACIRRAAYRQHGQLATDPLPSKLIRAAIIGEAIHAAVARARRAAGWTLVEEPATVAGLPRPGRLDGYHAGRLDDVKSVSRRVFDSILEAGCGRPEHVDQVEVYALAEEVARRRVAVLSLTYVCRDDGRTFQDTWNPDPEYARGVVAKLAELNAQITAGQPDDFGRAASSPYERPCDGCPFRTACWGAHDPRPEPARPVLGEALEEAARRLQAAYARRREADQEVESLRGLLSGHHGAEFTDDLGIRRRIRWTAGSDRGGPLDQRAARRLLELWGEEPPTLGTAPRISFPTIS